LMPFNKYVIAHTIIPPYCLINIDAILPIHDCKVIFMAFLV
jgi:hypothetical protein